MNSSLFSIATLLFLISCANVNQESRTYYQSSRMRHGIVPLDVKNVEKKLDVASVARGKMLYQKNCLSCHGETGVGDGPLAGEQKQRPANLSTLVREVPDFHFFMSISQWQGSMPGWKDQYDRAEKDDLVAYLKTFR